MAFIEIWKEIDGFPDYEVSNLGRIKSKARIQTSPGLKFIGKRKREIILRSFFTSNRFKVSLYSDGCIKSAFVHKLVAKAFVDNSQNYKYVVFKDDNPRNIKAENLLWVQKRPRKISSKLKMINK